MKKGRQYERMAWSYRALEVAPDDAKGVYAFWCRENGKCVYVGKAYDQSIGKRLRQHWRGSHNRTLGLWLAAFGAEVDLCYAPMPRERVGTLERRLIRLWNPEANVHHKK